MIYKDFYLSQAEALLARCKRLETVAKRERIDVSLVTDLLKKASTELTKIVDDAELLDKKRKEEEARQKSEAQKANEQRKADEEKARREQREAAEAELNEKKRERKSKETVE